jgi:ATP/maltotriose-dependent transcriptional regulator MalT/two-component SAPR family response regulator
MNAQVTRTKIITPRRRTDLLSRQRLLDTLDELIDFRLIILIAPAGYGKTFLLVDFAHYTELPVCWYALDPLDRDLYRFFVHFIAAISEQFPDFGRASTAALESLANNQGTLDQFITTIVNEIYEHIHEHFVLVIDDFFLVEDNADLNLFISRFVQQVDENCHIILASRKLLSIPDMALLIARGYVGGMDYEDLAYAIDELQALTEHNFGYAMAQAEAEALIDATDGWIIGLLLSAQSKLRSISGRMRLMRASGLDLYDYLAEQVLNQQPPMLHDFLLRTSLLEEFDAALCAEILPEAWCPPESSWQDLIAEVLRRNLFVLPLGEESSWLRYNHVFQDFLQKRLMKSRPEEERLILARLATYYQQQQAWEKAHYYLKRLGDLSAVADLAESAGLSLLYAGRLSLLRTWLEELPAGFVAERPVLLALQGDILTRHGDVQQGLATLTAALNQLSLADQPVMLAHALVRCAVAHRLRGDYEEARNDTDRVLALLPQIARGTPHLGQVHAMALRSKGTVLFTQGKPEEGLVLLEEALAAYEEIQEEYNAASIRQDKAVVALQLVRYREALVLFQQALTAWQAFGNLAGQALVLNNIGYLYHLQGEYEAALDHLEQALDCARRSGSTRMVAYTCISMGDLFTDLELWSAAHDIYQQARPITKQLNEQFLFLTLELALVRLASLQADWQAVYHNLDNASRLVLSKKSGYEWGLYQLAVGRCHLMQQRMAEAIEPLIDAQHYFEAGNQPIEAATAYFLLAAAWDASKEQRQAQAALHKGIATIETLERHHALLAPLRLIHPYLQQKKTLAANPAVADLLTELDAFEQAIPKVSRQLRKRVSPTLAPALTRQPYFHIRTLGQVEVTVEGKSLTTSDWQTIISRDLFLCLLAHPEGLKKETIGLIFWPDATPSELKTRFKNAIYRLRSALRQNVVLYTDDIYHYNWAIDYQYDVEDFLQKIGEGDKTADRNARIEAYQAALTLYHGAYLPEVDGSWVLAMRQHLQQLFVDTGMALAALYYEARNLVDALAVCQRVLEEDICLEDAHRLAMKIYAAQGNRAAVARQFAACQQALLNEVDVPPSHQTAELYATLMQ